jgi:hypothetical protein
LTLVSTKAVVARRTLRRLLAVAFALVAQVARADDRAECADAAEEGQRKRDAADLLAARELFVRCARAVCPTSVQRSCVSWLEELEPRIPSLVVGVRDAEGQDVIGARILLDGVERPVDGTAVAVNPGVHEVTVVSPTGRRTVLKVVAREGEKVRRVDVREEPRVSRSNEPLAAASSPKRGGLPMWPAFAFAGVGAAGFATYGIFDANARSTYDELRESCSPTCSPDQLSSLRTKVTISDVGLVVGISGAVLGAVWFVAALATKPATSTSLGRPYVVRF